MSLQIHLDDNTTPKLKAIIEDFNNNSFNEPIEIFSKEKDSRKMKTMINFIKDFDFRDCGSYFNKEHNCYIHEFY